ncbi:MAG: hypothetical protein GF408_01400 [Candidatus Omnitrophica bacterium]|nr:hypothetical protein [Candidatus Omnitrophota bacterium]
MKKYILIISVLALLPVRSFSPEAGALNMIRALPEVKEDYGKVVLIRPRTRARSVRDYNVYLNYFVVDRLEKGTYAEYRLPPGKYRLYTGNDLVSSTVEFDIEKGEQRYFETRIKSFGDEFPVIELYEIDGYYANTQTERLRKGEIDYDPRSYPVLPLKS